MEVSWMLIHTPEAESLCFYRHRDRKCHLPSVMTHCQCVDVYFFFKKEVRQEAESRANTTESSQTIHAREKEVWGVDRIAQCHGVWQPWLSLPPRALGRRALILTQELFQVSLHDLSLPRLQAHQQLPPSPAETEPSTSQGIQEPQREPPLLGYHRLPLGCH